MDSASEHWKPVGGFEDLYEVSDSGRVRRIPGSPRCPNGRIVKPVQMKRRKNYLCVGLFRDNRGSMRRVHRLVVEAFIGPIPEGMHVNHLNGDKSDNSLKNLEVVTPSENNRHAYRTGLRTDRGESHYKAVLTEKLVRSIRSLHVPGRVGYRTIARVLGIPRPEYVRDVLKGKLWAHVA